MNDFVIYNQYLGFLSSTLGYHPADWDKNLAVAYRFTLEQAMENCKDGDSILIVVKEN